ncbi:MAG: hypothetical protein A2351_06445 [Omnitrophica bacterium RIFOXYB12_FULL_50_7]|nr:MAG: hypothetical protein A2351_06445 [Omnitrophica bacterium RIFOXYB12_FULL_50_7]
MIKKAAFTKFFCLIGMIILGLSDPVNADVIPLHQGYKLNGKVVKEQVIFMQNATVALRETFFLIKRNPMTGGSIWKFEFDNTFIGKIADCELTQEFQSRSGIKTNRYEAASYKAFQPGRVTVRVLRSEEKYVGSSGGRLRFKPTGRFTIYATFVVDVVSPSELVRNVSETTGDNLVEVELVPSGSVFRTEEYGWLTIGASERSSTRHKWKNLTYQLNEKGPYGKVTRNALNPEVSGWGKLLKGSWDGVPFQHGVKLAVGYWKAPGMYQYMVHLKANIQPSGETKTFSSKPITVEIVKPTRREGKRK